MKAARPLLFAVLIAGCNWFSSSPPPEGPQKLEIFSWFTAGSERNALKMLFTDVQQQHPDIASITNAAQDDPDNALTLLATRVADGNPPDSFQVVSGSDLDEWIQRQMVEPLDWMAASQGWSGVFPLPVLQSVSYQGALYGVPLDIERDNTIFYNRSLVGSMPTTIDDIMVLARSLQARGVTPFAVSDTDGWTMSAHIFESVLVAKAGADFYQAYLTGQKPADATEVQDALLTTAEMLAMANPDAGTTKWTDAVSKVCLGQAAMLVLPDFVKGEFKNQGCDDTKIGYVPLQPANEPTFVFVSVTFELPRGAPDRDATIQFLETAGSAQGQIDFNLLKGAIPARVDANIQAFDSISRQTFADFTAKGEKLVPGYAALTAQSFQTEINGAFQKFADPTSAAYRKVPLAIAALKANYPQINQL
jgi:glucose/mannose transport system substrate-binding protein